RFKMGFSDYIQALEEERRKIQVFPKELPLSLELVTQAIEACRQQLSGTTTEYNLNGQQSECSEQTTTSTDGPVLEEFIPIKKRASPYCEQVYDDDEEEDNEQHSHHKQQKISMDKKKSDWLRSVHNNAANSKRDEKEEKRKQRRCWSQDLHKRFLQALQQLGGADSATPKQIRELMNVDGLTNDEVKSHLQKYRLHTRRPSPSNNESANSQTAAPFVLVGNIFVQQQQEYGGVASSTTSGEMTKVVAPSGIYAPVATHPPPPAATIKKPEFKKFEHSISEDRANNNSEGAVHSNSPTSSSSTHNTTNTSIGY
ncbi:hypothetical protein TSUD_40030, partial [Trifolium subterraneum]